MMNSKIFPTLVGGVGNLCNNDTQFHQQNRIYDAEMVSIAVTTCCLPYYVYVDMEKEKITCEHILNLNYYNHEASDRVYSGGGQVLQCLQKEKMMQEQLKSQKEDVPEVKVLGTYDKDKKELNVNPNYANKVNKNLRIRKLTPYECMALMGFDRIDYLRMKYINCGTIEECNAFDELHQKYLNRTMNRDEWKRYKNDYLKQQLQTDAQIYHEAGDSIVVDTLYHMYMEMM